MSEPSLTPAAPLDEHTTDQVRIRREQLRLAGERLASAAAAPFPGRRDLWWAGVANAAQDLATKFEHHVHETEGTTGLFAEIEHAAPRLSNEVDKLRAEHRDIEQAMGTLTSSSSPESPEAVAAAREAILEVLSRLARHRFAGSDLLYQAYQIDIGTAD